LREIPFGQYTETMVYNSAGSRAFSLLLSRLRSAQCGFS
jgi:hypothetical protein